jgi:hypothetical protein
MSKKKTSLKNYLEPINFEMTNLQQLEEIDELNETKPYPFTKSELLSYIVTDEFLESINYSSEENITKGISSFDLKKIFENISFEIKQDEIAAEKRRRYQAYKSLEYQLSNFTFFDFFSADAFDIIKNSKFLSQIYKQKQVTSEFLFLPFFDSKFEIATILEEFGFNENFIQNFCFNLEEISQQKSQVKNKLTFLLQENSKNSNKTNSQFGNILAEVQKKLGFTNQLEESSQKEIQFSYEANQLFEKSADNAMVRFKTPIITPEILFISLMEEKNFLIGKLIKKELLDETNWYLLRYKLLKKLYNQEVIIKSEIKKSHQFFAYLLKTQISEANFQKLIEKKALEKAVSLFRNYVIRDVLKSNFLENFDVETHASIMTGATRYYSKK